MCSTFKLLASAAVLKRVDAGRGRSRALHPLRAGRPARLCAGDQGASRFRRHDARRALRGGDRLERQHRRQSDPERDRRTGGLHRLRPLAGRLRHSARPRRADAQHGRSRRSARHDEPARHGARSANGPARRRAVGGVEDAASKPGSIADKVGDKRLRAGLPPNWGIGDKTGSGDHGTANTIAILRPPGRAPLLAAVYYTEGPDSMDARNAVNRQVGEIIAATF